MAEPKDGVLWFLAISLQISSRGGSCFLTPDQLDNERTTPISLYFSKLKQCQCYNFTIF